MRTFLSFGRTLALAAAVLAPAAHANNVIVLNSAEATLSLIDQQTRQVVSTMPTGKEPHHLMITPDNASLIVANSVSNSLIDVWIMLIMGGVGYVLRKFEFDLAPVALGLVLAPMLELSLRQSLAMSAGDYSIFVQRPIALTMLCFGALLLLLALKPLFSKKKDWRSTVGLDEPA